jgi:Zn-dependent protease/CBS domain-containing protein
MNYFRLGRVYGIDIHVNWSWMLIFALVSWSLSLTFGQIHPEWPMTVRWGMATLAAFLFFLSVLAHELAHSLVALARGVPVCNITLFMLGGVSNMQREPSSPAEEVVITIVGPLTSLFLGAVCLAAGLGGMTIQAGILGAPTIPSQLEPLRTALAWLGSVNVLIGFFNLLPAFPLDGGRMIRALIWTATKDIRRSTYWAVCLAQGIAWTMILGGVIVLLGIHLPAFPGGLFNGIWLVVIGAFLSHAARAGYRQAVVEDRLASVQVRSVMQTQVPAISSNASLSDLLGRNLAQPEGHTMFVVDGQEVVGMVAVRDMKKSLQDKWKTATVSDIMTPVSDLLYVTAEEDVAEAFDRLQRFDMRHMPVMFNNKIVGLLHRKDVNHLLRLHSQPGS